MSKNFASSPDAFFDKMVESIKSMVDGIVREKRKKTRTRKLGKILLDGQAMKRKKRKTVNVLRPSSTGQPIS